MPRYKMTYPYSRLFSTSVGLVQPDEVVEADENPDPNFFEETTEPVSSADSASEAEKAPAASWPSRRPSSAETPSPAPATTEPEEAS